MKSDDIRDLCALARVSGILETLAAMRGATITDSLTYNLEHACERMDECASHLFDKVLPRETIPPKEVFGRVYPGQEDASDQ